MWIMLNNAFFSIVNKDCPKDCLLVRARRPGDIERVFGDFPVSRDNRGDYLFRARIPKEEIAIALLRQIAGIDYPNFKDSVRNIKLKHAYMEVWEAMAKIQPEPPYSGAKED